MKKWIFLFLLSYAYQPFVNAQIMSEKDTTLVSLFQKIKENEITHVILTTDFDSLLKSRLVKDYPKIKARIIFNNKAGADTMKVKLALRGRYRRKLCDMPPIKLDFSKKELAKKGLNPMYDELKLVTHCLDGTQSEQTLLKEYWTYRLQQQITDNSFQVHLFKITYINTKKPTESRESLAFLIENNLELADRIGGEMVNKFGLTPSKVDITSYHYSLMFNYMIGNLDWNMLYQRNVKYIQTAESLVVVPYDFDQSALVNAPYAKPHPDYRQKKLTDRFCVGRFENATQLKNMAAEFLQESERLHLFKECPYLAEKYKLRMEKYLKSFFKEIQNKRKLKKAFLTSSGGSGE